MAEAVEAITATVQTYLDGLYEGDAAKIGQAFHEASHLYSSVEGKLSDLPRDIWLENVRKRPSPKSQKLSRHDRIVSIDMSGPQTAFVKVECAIPPRFFTDYLTLLHVGGQWRVVAKVFHTDVRK